MSQTDLVNRFNTSFSSSMGRCCFTLISITKCLLGNSFALPFAVIIIIYNIHSTVNESKPKTIFVIDIDLPHYLSSGEKWSTCWVCGPQAHNKPQLQQLTKDQLWLRYGIIAPVRKTDRIFSFQQSAINAELRSSVAVERHAERQETVQLIFNVPKYIWIHMAQRLLFAVTIVSEH